MTHEEFMEFVREDKKKWEGYKETEAGRLFLRINKAMGGGCSDEECLQLEQDIKEFYKSSPTEEDRRIIRGYPEAISMKCQAIRERRAEQ